MGSKQQLLQPVAAGKEKPRFGLLRGKIEMSSDFDAPLDQFLAYRR